MAKIDLDSFSIEQLAALRDHATEKLMEKVAARQAELEAEMGRLSDFGKQLKKSPTGVPVPKAKKTVTKQTDEASDGVAEAA